LRRELAEGVVDRIYEVRFFYGLLVLQQAMNTVLPDYSDLRII
jgi:hypothetical protein